MAVCAGAACRFQRCLDLGAFHESLNHDYVWVLTLPPPLGVALDPWGHWKILVRVYVTDEMVVVFGPV